MAYMDFVFQLYKATKQDYIGHITSADNAKCASIIQSMSGDIQEIVVSSF